MLLGAGHLQLSGTFQQHWHTTSVVEWDVERDLLLPSLRSDSLIAVPLITGITSVGVAFTPLQKLLRYLKHRMLMIHILIGLPTYSLEALRSKRNSPVSQLPVWDCPVKILGIKGQAAAVTEAK